MRIRGSKPDLTADKLKIIQYIKLKCQSTRISLQNEPYFVLNTPK